MIINKKLALQRNDKGFYLKKLPKFAQTTKNGIRISSGEAKSRTTKSSGHMVENDHLRNVAIGLISKCHQKHSFFLKLAKQNQFPDTFWKYCNLFKQQF